MQLRMVPYTTNVKKIKKYVRTVVPHSFFLPQPTKKIHLGSASVYLLSGLGTVHDCYSLQSCMVGFRMVSTFFIAFFSDFGRDGFVEN